MHRWYPVASSVVRKTKQLRKINLQNTRPWGCRATICRESGLAGQRRGGITYTVELELWQASQEITTTEPPATPETAEGLPSNESANAAIDAGFKRWSSAWMFDRYIPGSARISDRGLKDDTYVIRGVFDFARMGAKQTIPFAAAFTKPKKL